MRITSATKVVMAASAATVLALGTTGCSMVESVQKSTADAWSVTYELTVTGDTINGIDNVGYLEAAGRGEDSELITEGAVATTNDADAQDTAHWSIESIVTAERDVAISATPREGARLTCRILLDGEREIATATAGPGETVECQANTPAFDD